LGGLKVDDNARCLSNCSHAERQLLRSLAGALPRIADFELKILLGTHLWDIAQTLGDFSRRLSELREHAEYPGRPGEPFEAILNTIDQAPSSVHEVTGVYHVFLPALCSSYGAYIAACDPLLDEPTVHILRAAWTRHQTRCAEILPRIPRDPEIDCWCRDLGKAMESLGPLEHIPLRPRELRPWPRFEPLNHFERPPHFSFGPNHGIDPRSIYGGPDEFFFPIDEQFRQHFLHHMVDAEMVAAELMACNIHEFPEMPLAFHIDMARQVWDEVRHAHVQWEMLKNMGVSLGSYPVYHAYDLALYRRGLLDRLILFNRVGEAGAAQRHFRRSRHLRDNGLPLWANLFDYLHADEVPHVANGDRWARHLFSGSAEELRSYCRRVEAEFQSEFSEVVKG
jgi:hypothetical protein